MFIRRVYEWFGRHRFLVDSVFAAILWLVLALPSITEGLVEFVLSSVLTLPLAWRRVRPVIAGIICTAGALISLGFLALSAPEHPFFPAANPCVVLVVYALSAYGPRWASLAGLILGSAGAVAAAYFALGRAIPHSEIGNYVLISLFLYVFAAMLVVLAWTAGALTRTRQLRLRELEDRARRLEVEQQHERAIAANDERAHIAREMHDIIAHSLSVIITQADGARYAAVSSPEKAPETLATIAETGRQSLREMRRLLGILRTEDDAVQTRPLPGLGEIQELINSYQSAGLRVRLNEHNTARRPLPAGAELSAYRVVQEALTNVLRHASSATEVHVSLSWEGNGLSLSIIDDGAGPTKAAESGGGNGLRGMSERLALYDGTLTAGPIDSDSAPTQLNANHPTQHLGQGFQVLAFIPYTQA